MSPVSVAHADGALEIPSAARRRRRRIFNAVAEIGGETGGRSTGQQSCCERRAKKRRNARDDHHYPFRKARRGRRNASRTQHVFEGDFESEDLRDA